MDHLQEASASFPRWNIEAALAGPAGDVSLLSFENIAEENLEVPALIVEEPAQPPADAPIEPPGPIQEASGLGIVLAQVYGIDEEGLKDDHGLKDVKVGEEVLVVNPTLQGIMPDQLQAIEDVQATPDQASIILEQLTGAFGVHTKYTATVAVFIPSRVTLQSPNADTSPTSARLAESGLEAIAPARALEKDGEGAEEPALKRLAVEKDL